MSESSKDLQAVEKALKSLLPDPGGLDRDRLMFDAGRASVRPSKTWPLAAFTSSALAATFAVVLVVRPAPPPVVQIVHVPAPKSEAPPPEVQPSPEATQPVVADRYESESTHSYGRLQDHLLRFSLDLPGQAPLPPIAPMPTSEIRVERGATRTPGLLAAWWFSRGSNP